MRQLCVTPASTGHFAPARPPPQKQLRLPPTSRRHRQFRARHSARHFGEAPCPPAAPPMKAPPMRQLRAAAAQLRAPASAAPGPVSRRSFTGPAGQPPRLRVARQTLSSAAGHERDRAKFSPRTPANTGRPKLPPRKSPRPSPPCALMSADRRTWPQRRLARGRLEKSNGCKPATPDPPIAEAVGPLEFRGHRRIRHTAVPPHRSPET